MPTPLLDLVHQGRSPLIAFLRSLLVAPVPTSSATFSQRLLDGLAFGGGQGLGVSGSGQLFVLGYLARWNPAWIGVLPSARPALDLGAAIGLLLLLLRSWQTLVRHLRTERDWLDLAPVVAAVPCLLFQHVFGVWAAGLLGAAGVGALLIATGRTHAYASRRSSNALVFVAPLPALAAGLVASLGVFVGASTVALLLAAAVTARVEPAGAARFALMTATIVFGVQGLAHVAAVPAASPLLVGAALGTAAGGWLLLAAMGRWRAWVWPWFSYYATAMGAMLLLLGVFVP